MLTHDVTELTNQIAVFALLPNDIDHPMLVRISIVSILPTLLRLLLHFLFFVQHTTTYMLLYYVADRSNERTTVGAAANVASTQFEA